MTRVVFQVRCSAEEKARFEESAVRAGLSLSAWVRRACDETEALELAAAREDVVDVTALVESVRSGPPVVHRVSVPAVGDLAGKYKPDPR